MSEQGFDQAVYLHRLGVPAALDRLVLGPRNGLPRTAEIFLDNSQDGPAALASVQLGDGGQWQQYVLQPDGAALQVAAYVDRIIAAVIGEDGTIYGVFCRDAPLGKVVRLAAPCSGGFAATPVIVPAHTGAAIVNGRAQGMPLLLTGDRLVVNRIAGGPNEVSLYDLSGRSAGSPERPPVSTTDEIDALPGVRP